MVMAIWHGTVWDEWNHKESKIKISILVVIGIKSLCHIHMVFAFLAQESIFVTNQSVSYLWAPHHKMGSSGN